MDVPEVAPAGHALYELDGYTVQVDTCEACAKALKAPWIPALFSGTCRGCECNLIP